MTVTPTPAEIKHRYLELEAWATSYTARLETTLQAQTQWQRIHCFVMDQFQNAFPDEHISRDQRFVFIALRVAINLKDQNPAVINQVKTEIRSIKASFQMLHEGFHDTANVIDLDWHISEKERDEDQGETFASRVLADCLAITRHLERENGPSHLQNRGKTLG